MGRRSRKRIAPADARPPTSRAERDEARRRRSAAVAAERPEGERPAAPRRSGRRDDRPPAPWGSFPLTEIIVLVALVLGVVGIFTWEDRGRELVLVGLALGSLAGLELSLREHLAGYRSHTTLLAAVTTFVFVTVFLLVAGSVQLGAVAILAAIVFAAGLWGFRELFKARSGGLGFR
jgi:hypothetical protein